jgi:hypothetical protein
MSRYLLDTDWVVDVLNGQDTAAHTPEPALAGLRSFLKGKALLSLAQPVMERFAYIRGVTSPEHQTANRGS